MKLLQKLINKQGLKTFLSIGIVLVVFGGCMTFAATETKETGLLDNINAVLITISSFISRLWIVLAIIAGKLMSNDWVFGASLHLDMYLWKIRNIVKNFANFGLIAMILVAIIKYITKKDGNPKDIITKALIAGIGIQASWFMVGALVDVSNIVTATIASFPGSFIQNSEILSSVKNTTDKIAIQKTIIKDFEIVKTDTNKQTETSTININDILPKGDSVAGTLMYLGMSVLKIHNYMDNTTKADLTPQNVGIDFTIKTIIGVFYTIVLLLLCVANVMRLVFIWMFIATAPLLVLGAAFDMGKNAKSGIAQRFDFKKVLTMIFKPVFFVAYLALVLIFTVNMRNIMQDTKPVINNVEFTTTGDYSEMQIKKIAGIRVNGSFYKKAEDAKNITIGIFGDLLLMLLTIFLLRYLLKIAITQGGDKDPISKTMEKMTKNIEDIAANIPITAVKSSFGNIGKDILKGAGLNKDFTLKSSDKQNNKLRGLFGLQSKRAQEDYEELEETIETTSFFNKIKEKNDSYNFSLQEDNVIKSSIEKHLQWLQENNKLDDAGFTGSYTEETTREDFFGATNDTADTQKNRKKLYEELSGETLTKDITYKDFMKKIFGKKETK